MSSLTLSLLLALATPPPDERAIDAAVRHALKLWSVPGTAVVIVKDDRVVYCQGYGVRHTDKDDPVTPDTLFALSSGSKAFTSAALALLVEEGRLHWDDPVQKHLPWFRLADDLVERDVTLRDLLCHRTGLAGHELLWRRAPWSPEEAVRRLRHLPLSRPFRTTLQYQSTTFAAAGLAAARAAGTSWPDLVRNRLLRPLDMPSTCLSDAEAARADNRASPHRMSRDRFVEAMPRHDTLHPDPAVTIHSTARDLSKWLRFHLREGKPLVAAKHLRETHSPQMVIRLTPEQQAVFPDTTQLTYALGWAVHDYRGLKHVSHGGAIDGIRVHLTFVPERRLGVAVLTNLDRTPMAIALANTLVDQQLGFPKRDWHAVYRKLQDELGAIARHKFEERLKTRRLNTKPSRDLPAYAGTYDHPAYGTITLALAGGKLTWRWRGEEAALEHLHHDTFLLQTDLIGQEEILFTLDRAGDVVGFRVASDLNVDFRKTGSKRQ